MDVDSSLSQLEKLIAEEAPMGPLVVGGFSQGGAMAQELLQLPIADRIQGVVCMATRLVRPMELRLRLNELESKRLFWMRSAKRTFGSPSRTVGPSLIFSSRRVGPWNSLNTRKGT